MTTTFLFNMARKLYTGKLYLLPELRISKKGVEWAMFALIDKRQDILRVLCFGDLAKRAAKELKELTVVVKVDGEEMEQKPGDRLQVKAFGFSLPGAKPTNTPMPIKKQTKEEYNDYVQGMERDGYALTVDQRGFRTWKKRENLCKVNGTWTDPMDYAMQILTPSTVMSILKEEGVMSDLPKLKKILKDLVTLASTDSGATIEWE